MDLNEESYPKYEDLLLLPFFALFFPLARLLLDRLVFENHGRRLIVPETKSEDQKKKLNKFKESAWKCVYFLSAEAMALAVTYNEPWFTDTKFFWQGPGNQTWPHQKYKLKLKGLFMYTGGFYTYSIFSLMFWETRRSDFAVSMGHHVASSFLIVLAYVFRFARVGSVVLALHDATDVFLEVGKMSKYSGIESIAGVSFILFVFFFFVLRLIYYPFWILRSTSYEVIQVFNNEEGNNNKSSALAFYYYVFNTLLFSLLVLHVYWFGLMLRMLVDQIRAGGRVSEDVRSDSEDDDDDGGQHED